MDLADVDASILQTPKNTSYRFVLLSTRKLPADLAVWSSKPDLALTVCQVKVLPPSKPQDHVLMH